MRSEFIAVAVTVAVEVLAIPRGDGQPWRGSTAMEGIDSPRGEGPPNTSGPIEFKMYNKMHDKGTELSYSTLRTKTQK